MPYAGVVQRLASHAGAHPGDRFAPSRWNDLIAVFAPICPFPRGDEAPGELDSILNAVVDLFLAKQMGPSFQ